MYSFSVELTASFNVSVVEAGERIRLRYRDVWSTFNSTGDKSGLLPPRWYNRGFANCSPILGETEHRQHPVHRKTPICIRTSFFCTDDHTYLNLSLPIINVCLVISTENRTPYIYRTDFFLKTGRRGGRFGGARTVEKWRFTPPRCTVKRAAKRIFRCDVESS